MSQQQPADKEALINQQKIIDGLNKLRKEQRFYTVKISEFEADVKEHRLVIDALKDINDEKRGCYRLVGGVLVGRTVGEILPSLEKNIEQIAKLQENFKNLLVEKGKEINEYMRKFNIRPVTDDGKPIQDSPTDKSQPSKSGGAVLVGQ